MTFLESKLLDYFRKCDDDRKSAILEMASLCADPVTSARIVEFPQASASPDPDDVQTSILGEKMLRTAQKADIPARYGMMLGELNYLHDLIEQENSAFNALSLAFDYGFVKGHRATRRGKVKAL